MVCLLPQAPRTITREEIVHVEEFAALVGRDFGQIAHLILAVALRNVRDAEHVAFFHVARGAHL